MRKIALLLLITIPLVALAIWIGWYSPVLGVRAVTVTLSEAPTSAGPLTEEQVVAVAGVPAQTPLLRVDAEQVAARVSQMPEVRSVRVTREWPSTLHIDVRRRVPVAVVAEAGAYRLVDGEGVTMRALDAPIEGVALVDAAGEGLPAAVAVAHDLPGWLLPKVELIRASTRNDVTLVLRSGSSVLWGSADQGRLKGDVLRALMRTRAERYDVSAPGVPTTSDGTVASAPSTSTSPALP